MTRSKPLFLCAVFLLAAAVLPGCNRMPQGDPANGVRWFKLNRCNGCHGEGGIGGRGPTIAALELSFGRFLAKVRKPDSAIMPTFEPEQLSDQDAADIYLWLKDQPLPKDRS